MFSREGRVLGSDWRVRSLRRDLSIIVKMTFDGNIISIWILLEYKIVSKWGINYI